MRNRIILVVFAVFATILTACEPETYDTFGDISGTVIDEETREALEGVRITLSPSSKDAYTGIDGQFEIKGLEAGQYRLQAQKPGYQTNRIGTNVIGGENVTVSLVLKKEESSQQ